MWNHPKQEVLVAPKRRPSVVRGAVAGIALVAVLGVVLAVIFAGGDDAPKAEKDAKPAKIKEVTPASAPKVEPKTNAAVRVTDLGTPIPTNVFPDVHGIMRYPNGQRWVDRKSLKRIDRPKPRKLFNHTSENQIAVMLSLDPARMVPALIGKRRKFDERFTKDFVASFNDTIVIDKDDTPEEAALRKQVLAAKADLKEAMDRGEDIAQIMNDTQAELDRLATYRQDLIKALREYTRDESYSDADVEDFTKAANQMLEQNGLKKLAVPKLTYRQMMLSKMRERAAKKTQTPANTK